VPQATASQVFTAEDAFTVTAEANNSVSTMSCSLPSNAVHADSGLLRA
jgi:hypothetical protein